MSTFVVEYVYDSARSQDLDLLRPKHREFLGGLAEEGRVLLVGPSPKADGSLGAFVFITATDAAAALGYLDADPFYTAGLILDRCVRPFTVVAGGFAQS